MGKHYATPQVTAAPDKNLRIAITGSLVLHAVLFMILAWMFAEEAARKLWQQSMEVPKEKEVTLLFPEQIMPEPEMRPPEPPPPPKKEVYIRTSQNEAESAAPKNAPFISDRNTTAATVKAAAPDATEPLPTMDGLKLPTQDLADRDYKDGELKDDSRAKTPAGALAMLQPQPPTPPTPPSILKPKDAAPPPEPQVPPPQTMAKAVPESTPLTKMMEEADKALAKIDLKADVGADIQPMRRALAFCRSIEASKLPCRSSKPTQMRQVNKPENPANNRCASMSSKALTRTGALAVKKSTITWPEIQCV